MRKEYKGRSIRGFLSSGIYLYKYRKESNCFLVFEHTTEGQND